MKVVDATQATKSAQPLKQPFAQVMKQAKPAAPLKTLRAEVVKQLAAPTRTASPVRSTVVAAPAKQLVQARVQVDAEAKRLGVVRSEHTQTAHAMTQARTERGEQLEDKQTAKLMEALTQEFSKEPQQQPVMPVSKMEPMANATVKTDAPAETKAAQASALIEKIEHFVRSNRPGLSITLNNSLGARVELERIGPKALSVKLFGKPGAEAVGKIREELRARGLNVKLFVI